MEGPLGRVKVAAEGVRGAPALEPLVLLEGVGNRVRRDELGQKDGETGQRRDDPPTPSPRPLSLLSARGSIDRRCDAERKRQQPDLPPGHRSPPDRERARHQPGAAPRAKKPRERPERRRAKTDGQAVGHHDLTAAQHHPGDRHAEAGDDRRRRVRGAAAPVLELSHQQVRRRGRPGASERAHQLACERPTSRDRQQRRHRRRIAARPEQQRQRRAVQEVRPDRAREPEVSKGVLPVEAVERKAEPRDARDQQGDGERPGGPIETRGLQSSRTVPPPSSRGKVDGRSRCSLPHAMRCRGPILRHPRCLRSARADDDDVRTPG